VVNDIPDNEPWSGNYPYNTGNTLVIQKDNYFLLLGHLKKDSIKVQEGDDIHINDLVGSAGNSGWTERPHLHIQLIRSNSPDFWFGTGICIRYKNLNLHKDRLIII
jgi:murein DD-endopeptidase MepM/ murein hydrolase activator NlpD